jgi:hypothetical protein
MRNFAISAWLALFFAVPVLAGPVSATEIHFQHPDGRFIEVVSPNEFVLNEYNDLRRPKFVFDDPADVSSCTLDGKPCDASKEVMIALPAGTHGPFVSHLRFKSKGKPNETQIHVLPEDFPAFSIAGKAKSSDAVVLTPNARALVVSAAGEVLFFRKFPYGIENFRPHLVDGKRMYSYLRVEKAVNDLGSAGRRVLLDENFNFIRELPWPMDGHEFLWLGENHYLFLNYDQTSLDPGTCFIEATIREYDDNNKIFEIRAREILQSGILYRFAKPYHVDGKLCYEIYHLNSIQSLNENQLLINLGSSGVTLLNKKTRKPEWIFSGPSDQFSLGQRGPGFVHTVSFDEKTSRLLMFSNSWVGEEGGPSALLEFRLNIGKRKVERMDTLNPTPFISPSMGSIERTDDGYSVGAGERKTGPADFFEVFAKKITFQLRFDAADPPTQSYRAYRVRNL